MAKGPDWNDVHLANPGALRDALTEPDIPFETEEAPTASRGNGHGAAGEPIDEAGAKAPRDVPGEGVSLDDFRAFMEMHAYIFTPSGAMWPASSVNSRIPPVPIFKKKW